MQCTTTTATTTTSTSFVLEPRSRSSVVVVVVVVVVAMVVVVEKLVLLRTTIATLGKDVGKGGMRIDYSFSPRHPGITTTTTTTTAVTCERVCAVIVGEVRISLPLSVCFILTQLCTTTAT